ncbi:mucin-5AC-like isoform X2 [Paramacrobiotus metropolitanus]|nr:mucin-5AC-like isoform X2 [Paramacrobiotus metropolitanus]XP_055336959.1 mucin-5AC-like isoform X2 [Paramacrobiotus metropolitanus]XP_055336960.1 mucin-5AC-like isoform X2 [Paramacrobiotus metropolitanus]
MDPLRRLEEISRKLKELQRLTRESPQLRLNADAFAEHPAPRREPDQPPALRATGQQRWTHVHTVEQSRRAVTLSRPRGHRHPGPAVAAIRQRPSPRGRTLSARRPTLNRPPATLTSRSSRCSPLPVCTCRPDCPRSLSPGGPDDSLASSQMATRLGDPYPRIGAPPAVFTAHRRQQQSMKMAKCLMRDTCATTVNERFFLEGKETARCSCRVVEISSSETAVASDECLTAPLPPVPTAAMHRPDAGDLDPHTAQMQCGAAVPLRAPQTLTVNAACSPTHLSLASAHNQTQPAAHASCGAHAAPSQCSAQVSTSALCHRADTGVQCSQHPLPGAAGLPVSVCTSTPRFAVPATKSAAVCTSATHTGGAELNACRSQACQTAQHTVSRSQSADRLHNTTDAAAGRSACQLAHSKSAQALTATLSAFTQPHKFHSEQTLDRMHVGTSAAPLPCPPPKDTRSCGTTHSSLTTAKSACTGTDPTHVPTNVNAGTSAAPLPCNQPKDARSCGTSHSQLVAVKSGCTSTEPELSVNVPSSANVARTGTVGPFSHSTCSVAKQSKSVQWQSASEASSQVAGAASCQCMQRRSEVKRLLVEVASQQAQERQQASAVTLADARSAHICPTRSNFSTHSRNQQAPPNRPLPVASCSAVTVGGAVSGDPLHSTSTGSYLRPDVGASASLANPTGVHPSHTADHHRQVYDDHSQLLSPNYHPHMDLSQSHHSTHFRSLHSQPTLYGAASASASINYPITGASGASVLAEQPSVWPAPNASQFTLHSSNDSAISYFPSSTTFFSNTSLNVPANTTYAGDLRNRLPDENAEGETCPLENANPPPADVDPGDVCELPVADDVCPLPAVHPLAAVVNELADAGTNTSCTDLKQASAKPDTSDTDDTPSHKCRPAQQQFRKRKDRHRSRRRPTGRYPSSPRKTRRKSRRYRDQSCRPTASQRAVGKVTVYRSDSPSSSPSRTVISSTSTTPTTFSPGRVRSEGEFVYGRAYRDRDRPADYGTGTSATGDGGDVDWGHLVDALVDSSDNVRAAEDDLCGSLSDSTLTYGTKRRRRMHRITQYLPLGDGTGRSTWRPTSVETPKRRFPRKQHYSLASGGFVDQQSDSEVEVDLRMAACRPGAGSARTAVFRPTAEACALQISPLYGRPKIQPTATLTGDRKLEGSGRNGLCGLRQRQQPGHGCSVCQAEAAANTAALLESGDSSGSEDLEAGQLMIPRTHL